VELEEGLEELPGQASALDRIRDLVTSDTEYVVSQADGWPGASMPASS
jgi:hypothetical protein